MNVIPLNIMTTYPVKWSKLEILRDIIQNFYDDAGIAGFGEKFKREYLPNVDDGKLVFSMESDGFSYEWLLHMGASTKQEQSGKFAGFFGEGFKIASLCALRDYGWKIKMRSRRWSLSVIVVDTDVDGKILKQLAYEVEDNLPHSTETVLSIDSFSADDVALAEDAVLRFLYPENPLLGKLVFDGPYAAIYERSKVKKPGNYPLSFGSDGDGIVFMGYQARASFVRPLVIAHHRFKTSDRERKTVYAGTVQELLLDMVDLIDLKTTGYLLEQLRKYWYDTPDSKDDVNSWYSLIRKLVRRIVFSYSPDAYDIRGKFIEDYPDLVTCSRPTSVSSRNRRAQALAWRKIYLPNSVLVQDGFELMGYKSIVDLCERAGGFNRTREADGFESKLLKILDEAARCVLGEFLIDYPGCKVIENESSVYNGTAILIKNVTKQYNNCGCRVLYRLSYIEIKKNLLVRDSFFEAFSTYCHELCHCFGGDSSQSFSLALTRVFNLIMIHRDELERHGELWRDVFRA